MAVYEKDQVFLGYFNSLILSQKYHAWNSQAGLFYSLFYYMTDQIYPLSLTSMRINFKCQLEQPRIRVSVKDCLDQVDYGHIHGGLS